MDPDTGALRPVSARALQAEDDRHPGRLGWPRVEHELFLEQIETATVPCAGLAELDAELRTGRRLAAAAAEAAGVGIAALATAVVDVDAALTQKGRYQSMAAHHGALARENLVCGMHVHVEVAGDQEAVTALDRIRPWLPVLLALSANSPFWRGEDSGYASYRAQVVGRWPSAGPTEPFGTAAGYHAAVDQLIRTTAALDEAMIYFDARVAAKYPTLEIRVADVCTEVEDAVLVAALARRWSRPRCARASTRRPRRSGGPSCCGPPGGPRAGGVWARTWCIHSVANHDRRSRSSRISSTTCGRPSTTPTT